MKLSIITVNLNNRDGLIKTAESVIAQTWKDYEWIVIDGGSTDGSIGVINEYINKTSKITHWCSEKDNGIYHAMNKGINNASGEYCYFLNSGDYLCKPEVLEKIFTVDFGEDIIYGGMMFEGGKVRKFPSKICPPDLLYGFLPHQNMFIKTKLMNAKNGYRTDYKIVADWVFYTEAIFREKASYKHIPMVFAVNQRDGISGDPKFWSIQKEERKRAVEEMFSKRRRVMYFFSAASLKNKIEKIKFRLKKYQIIGE
jgi:glycosyltransferase involved in cell wall biosynthesis